MPKYKTILFDVDDTLFDFEQDPKYHLKNLCKQ